MKTHEFAKYLEQLAHLLRQLPDSELDLKHASGLQHILPGVEMASTRKVAVRPPRPLPDDIEARLASMSPAEIEAFLLSEDEAFTVANLSELVSRIGLASSKRQSKSALVNMITRHYEALKMHSIMRGARANDT